MAKFEVTYSLDAPTMYTVTVEAETVEDAEIAALNVIENGDLSEVHIRDGEPTSGFDLIDSQKVD